MSTASFEEDIRDARDALVNHLLYGQVRTMRELRVFMETHAFAVWDFMCLLKSLQARLTGQGFPWLPPADREAARLINEIVLGEESDELAPGVYLSHFELYLLAMKDCGADTQAIEGFVSAVRHGVPLRESLLLAPAPARTFVSGTLAFCRRAPHETAAAFLYGREDLIPAMFTRILAEAGALGSADCMRLRLYLERHVEIDGGSHGPMAKRLMESLCGSDEKKWREAGVAAREALAERQGLWDGVLALLKTSG
jgi:hypothetical protein